MHVPILTYHVIAPWAVAMPYSRSSLDISPELFDAQLDALHRAGWHSITVAALADFLAQGVRPSPKTFVLTIDDGHSDGATYALPILLKYGYVATYYVVAGRIGSPDNLSRDQIRELVANGMEIGNHTMEHVDLTIQSPAAARAQVDNAQAVLATVLGSPPTTFAYPFGAYDLVIQAIIAEAGLRMAVTTKLGASESWDARLQVPRIEIGPSFTPDDVLAKIGAYG